jgi:hypothetical protein
MIYEKGPKLYTVFVHTLTNEAKYAQSSMKFHISILWASGWNMHVFNKILG